MSCDQTYKQTDRQTNRQTNKQTDKQTDRQTTEITIPFKCRGSLSIFVLFYRFNNQHSHSLLGVNCSFVALIAV